MSFTEHLPAEVRLLIYEHAVLAPGRFFELWGPEVWTDKNRRRVRRKDRSPNDHVFYRQHASKHALPLMRLSKVVRDEVAGLFYGRHNFRFSSVNGAAALASWLYTVRPAQFQFLRHVSVVMPSDFGACNEYGGEDAMSIATSNCLCSLLRERCMTIPGCLKYYDRRSKNGFYRSEFWHRDLTTRAFHCLAEIPDLRRLDLLCHRFPIPNPDALDRRGGRCCCAQEIASGMGSRELIIHVIRDCSSTHYWDAIERLKKTTHSPKLVISLVLLHGNHEDDEWEYEWKAASGLTPWWQSPYHTWSEEFVRSMCSDRWLAAYADIMGYGFGHASWEGRSYTIQYGKDDPRLILPPPILRNVICEEPPELEEAELSRSNLPEALPTFMCRQQV